MPWFVESMIDSVLVKHEAQYVNDMLEKVRDCIDRVDTFDEEGNPHGVDYIKVTFSKEE